MSHNLNFNENTGKHSFFSVKEKAWHGLGQIVSEHPTSEQAIIHAGLDYQIVKRPIYVRDGSVDAQTILSPVPEHFATVRTDNGTPLGVVGKDYHVLQNREAFSFFDSIVGGGDGIIYETAGALGQGERIFITAKLPDYIKVGRDDLIEKYLFLTTSHDGSGSITAAFTPVRIVCANTLGAALKSMTNVVRIRHTVNAKLRLEQAHKVMGLSNRLSIEMEGIFNQWAKVRITDKEVHKLISMALASNNEILGNVKDGREEQLSTVFKNQCENAFSYCMENETQQLETTKGTVFGAYNAVSGYFQNVRGYKNDEAKVKSILMGGTGASKTQKAFDLCSAFARYGAQSLQ
jgi:phage/plasmid-like protein (TIGR03299 family)